MSTYLEAPFLLVLESAIRRDQASPGFQGKLAIGVVKEEAEFWWICTFGRSVRTHFASRAPEMCCATLLLSHRDAEGLLTNSVRGLHPVRFSGDRTLIKRFVRRYLHQQNMLTLRSQGDAK